MGLWATIIGGAVLSALLWLQTERVSVANERTDAVMVENTNLKEALELNSATLQAYKMVAASNAAQRDASRAAAAQARIRIEALNKSTAELIADIAREAETMRNESDDTCRTLVDGLPDWFTDRVYDRRADRRLLLPTRNH